MGEHNYIYLLIIPGPAADLDASRPGPIRAQIRDVQFKCTRAPLLDDGSKAATQVIENNVAAD